jgi:ammonia channel protein AmtB
VDPRQTEVVPKDYAADSRNRRLGPGAAFHMGHKLYKEKFDPVHIANATLAGGVAVGSSAYLAMTPGGALLLGVLAGVVSVYGYVYSTPMLEKLDVFVNCGMGHLHG